jgi:hypothetical protein
MGLKHRGGLGGLGGLRGLHVSPNVCLGDTLVSTRVNIRKENGREIKERGERDKTTKPPTVFKRGSFPFIPSSLSSLEFSTVFGGLHTCSSVWFRRSSKNIID